MLLLNPSAFAASNPYATHLHFNMLLLNLIPIAFATCASPAFTFQYASIKPLFPFTVTPPYLYLHFNMLLLNHLNQGGQS